MSSDAERSEVYSRAFELLVQDDDDLTGLLAYALYKQSIREASAQGKAVHPSRDRSLTSTEVRAWREVADGMLSAFASSIIDQSRSGIVETAVRDDIRNLKSSLSLELQRSTSWKTAVVVNLVAWLLSIAITILVVMAGVPSWVTSLIGKLKGG